VSEDGQQKRRGNPAWTKGQSGNPAGRPAGARSVLSEQFLSALQADFEMHGVRVIAKVRRYKPEEYLKLISRIVPQKIDLGGSIDVPVSERREDIQRKLDSIVAAGNAGEMAFKPLAGRA
jgi:hypothetical protein